MGHVYEEGGGAGLHPTKMLLQSLPNLTNQTTISQKSSNLGPHESFQTETYGRHHGLSQEPQSWPVK